MAKKIDVKAGAAIHLVLAGGKHAPATVSKVRGGERQLVDLEALVGDELVIITSSPLDEAGKRPDSWHLPEPEAPAETPKA